MQKTLTTQRRSPFLVLFQTAFLALLAPFAGADSAAPREARLMLEAQDGKGRPVSPLAPEDLELSEDGRVVTIEGVSPLPAAQVVLYFDRTLAGPGSLRRAAESLAELARPLTELGQVELVFADPEPDVVLTTDDPLVLGERLSRSALVESGRHWILELRRQTLGDLQRLSRGAQSAGHDEQQAAIVAEALREEVARIIKRQETLLAWLADHASDRPRILILVSDGFDIDPLLFYTPHLSEEALRGVARANAQDRTRVLTLAASLRDTGRTLAALGWTVLTVALPPSGEDAASRFSSFEIEDQQGYKTTAQGITLHPGSLFRRRDAEEDEAAPAESELIAELVNPDESLAQLAEPSGGERLRGDQGLRDAVTRLARRQLVTYTSQLTDDADLVPLEVRARQDGLSLKTRRFTSRGVPSTVTALRLRRLLYGFEPPEGFDVVAAMSPKASDADATNELEARLDLRDLPEPADEAAVDGDDPETVAPRSRAVASLRVTVAAIDEDGVEQLAQELFPNAELGGTDGWIYRSSLVPGKASDQIAVVIEDLDHGRWGGALAAVVRPGQGIGGGPDLLPAPTVIEIERPREEILRGRTRFATDVYDPAVRRVVFLLDDREVADISRPPFTARLDLGRTPRRQELTVIAYDGQNAELGRHAVILNGGKSGLDVEIVRPTTSRATGWVTAEADIAIPLENRLDRVLFFWNNEALATLYSPPFVQNVFIPDDQPNGYIRVVALLDDGTVAEDVLVMNGPDAGARVEVNLVELYTVVTDRDGRPVRGLSQEDFTIYEDGVAQEIGAFSDASDLPLTLGMAIDSSASMFVKLPRVQEAAIRFLRSTFSEQDRAFVVDFDSQPRLALGTTRELRRLIRAIEDLEADGRTALWESMVYSLVQLQGVRGRKSLVVFSDGADEDDQFPFRSCLDLARRMGVPIYLILMRKEPKDSGGFNLFTRSFTSRVERLVETTGGKVFYAKEYRDLGEVYDEIESELRSQYLLAYYPKTASDSEGWRDVKVEVTRRGLTPRTLSGYWQ